MPAVLFVDFELAGREGLHLLRRIRSHAVSGREPVVVATARSRCSTLREQALALGADAWLHQRETVDGTAEALARLFGIPRRAESGAA